MTERPTIGDKIVRNLRGNENVAAAIDIAVAEAFKTGFEQAVSGGKELTRKVPQLKDAIPLVLYFADAKDRQEFADMIHEAKPHMVECKVPEGT